MRLLIILLAGLTLASGAEAQTKPQQPAAAVAGQPSARQLELTRRYVDLMMSDQFETMIRQMIAIEASMDPDAQEMPDADRRFLTELASELVTDMIPQMLDEMVPVYARTFSEAELEALIAFYDTPVGRSIVLKEAEISLVIQEAIMPHMMTRMSAVGEKFCQRFDCSGLGEAAAKGAR